MESKKQKSIRLAKILTVLRNDYPDARCRLTYRTPFELLIKTILSAQCTDERVNQVGHALFSRYKQPEDFIALPLNSLEKIIRPTGFFHHKALHIKQTSEILVNTFSGKVPAAMEDLLQLPGVGRKTANVIRSTVFNLPSVIVDTHVIRLSNRLKLTDSSNPEHIESDLMALMNEKDWSFTAHALGEHGRRICKARTPLCAICPITRFCPAAYHGLKRNSHHRVQKNINNS